MRLPLSWVPISPQDSKSFEGELYREMIPSHQLYGRDLHAVARRGHKDDVLFISGINGPVFVVHLTWSVETNPTWPWTTAYENLDDFFERWPREELDDAGDPAG